MKYGILKQVTELETLSVAELKERWRELFGTSPPSHNRVHLIRRLAYRLQELCFGGVSEETRDQLRQHLERGGLDTETERASRMTRRQRKNDMPVVGTRIVREWHGQRYEVTVLTNGFEFEGRPYRSLSAIARKITNVRWNGPAFFGLRKPELQKEARG